MPLSSPRRGRDPLLGRSWRCSVDTGLRRYDRIVVAEYQISSTGSGTWRAWRRGAALLYREATA